MDRTHLCTAFIDWHDSLHLQGLALIQKLEHMGEEDVTTLETLEVPTRDPAGHVRICPCLANFHVELLLGLEAELVGSVDEGGKKTITDRIDALRAIFN